MNDLLSDPLVVEPTQQSNQNIFEALMSPLDDFDLQLLLPSRSNQINANQSNSHTIEAEHQPTITITTAQMPQVIQAEEQKVTHNNDSTEQESIFRAVPIRNQPHYQSQLSSTTSLATVQREYFIFFNVTEALRISGSIIESPDEEIAESKKSTIVAATSPSNNKNLIQVPIDDMHEDATVADAIHTSIYYINNILAKQKIGIRLADDDCLFDLYMAKKSGQKKSFPALYPLEKIQKFANMNMALYPLNQNSIIKPIKSPLKKQSQLQHQQSLQQQQKQLNLPGLKKAESTPVSDFRQGEAAEPIKEVRESLLSNRSLDQYISIDEISAPGKRSTNNLNQANGDAATRPSQRRSIQSTITPKQTKIDAQEHSDEVYLLEKSTSKCFPFSCCLKKSNSKQTQKKLQEPLITS